MTADEETILRAYLGRIGAIAEDDFEEWYRQRHESEEGEAEFKAALAEAKAFAMGCADVHEIKGKGLFDVEVTECTVRES